MQGMRLLLTNQVDHRTAALLFYALQTASSNLSRTTFEPRPQQVVIDPSSIADTSLGDDAWYKEEFTNNEDEDYHEEANSPTTVNIQANACEEADSPATINIQASARVEPGLRPGPVGIGKSLRPSGRVRNKARFASESSPGGAFELSPALQRGKKLKQRLKSRRDDRVLTHTLQGQLRPATSRPRSPAFPSTRNPETAYKMMSYEDEACGANHWSVSDRPGSHAVGGSAGG